MAVAVGATAPFREDSVAIGAVRRGASLFGAAVERRSALPRACFPGSAGIVALVTRLRADGP